jgi:hypothetical protein
VDGVSIKWTAKIDVIVMVNNINDLGKGCP